MFIHPLDIATVTSANSWCRHGITWRVGGTQKNDGCLGSFKIRWLLLLLVMLLPVLLLLLLLLLFRRAQAIGSYSGSTPATAASTPIVTKLSTTASWCSSGVPGLSTSGSILQPK